MTPEQRKNARERCEKATAEPWEACTGSGHCECTAIHSDAQEGIICDLLPEYEFQRDPHKPILDNLKFIESARTDLPAALDQMDADEGLMRDAKAACEAVVSIADSVGEGPFADALSGAELKTFVAALEACEAAGDALRARLGEVPAQGEEASDESI